MARPIDAADRIASIDLLRGVAVLGILLLNIGSFAMPEIAYWEPRAYGNFTGANALVQQLTHVFASGKFISIFAMLFGAGIVLQVRRGQTRARHHRRMVALLVIGLVHAYLLWHGDILVTYALFGLLAFNLRNVPPQTLIIIALSIYCAGLIREGSEALGALHAPADQQAAIRESLSPSAKQIAEEVRIFRGPWLGQLPLRFERAFSGESFVLLNFSVPYVGGLMVLGMALTRLGFFDGAWPRAWYAMIAVAGCTIGWSLAASQLWLTARWGDDPIRTSLAWPIANTCAMPLVAIGYAAGVQWVVGSFDRVPAMFTPLAAVGRTALSCYLLETIFGTTIFYGHGLGLFGKVDRVGQLGVVIAIWIVLLIVAPLWLRRFRFGPMEWLWRRATYGSGG